MDAYLVTIQEKTGKTIDDIRALAAGKEFPKHAAARDWVMAELGLGHGHASMVAKLIMEPESFERPDSVRIDGQYKGKKAHWRPLYERMLSEVQQLGPDVGTDASDAYVSFVRNGKKFAIAQPSTADRFDIGIKLKGEATTERFEAAGKWNPMVTHRVRITDPAQVDDDVMAWIGRAYAAIKP
jgi:predicted transport protein